jgi:hypothetical protein
MSDQTEPKNEGGNLPTWEQLNAELGKAVVIPVEQEMPEEYNYRCYFWNTLLKDIIGKVEGIMVRNCGKVIIECIDHDVTTRVE